MQAMKSILVVVDRSPAARDALAKAAVLARALQARIELFQCDADRGYALSQAYVSTGVEAARQSCITDSNSYLRSLCEAARVTDLDVAIEAECASPLYESVVRKVQRAHPDLVVKNVAGVPGVFDCTDWQLMRTCPATLMLTRGRPWRSPPKLGAAVDASGAETAGLAQDILQAGHFLAGSVHGQLEVVYSEAFDLGDEERERADRRLYDMVEKELPKGASDVHVLAGNPEVSLPVFAKQRNYDAMLLGALTHRPCATAQVGSLTSRLVEALSCDFILVKPSSYRTSVAPAPAYMRPSEMSERL